MYNNILYSYFRFITYLVSYLIQLSQIQIQINHIYYPFITLFSIKITKYSLANHLYLYLYLSSFITILF